MTITRRQSLGWLAASAAGLRLPALARTPHLSAPDEAFLDDLQRRGCLFFTEQAGPRTGQVLDRAAADDPSGALDPRPNASIAATGFGLSALCIAHHRGYADRDALQAQVLRTLRFHAEELPQEHGFFYHFNDITTGKPLPWSEVSSIDTALLICGVLTARAYFHSDPEIVRYAKTIYERVDWPWMLSRQPSQANQFAMGWKPTSGFIPSSWNHYCELMMIPLLALGSPTHPVSLKVWTSWSRPTVTYDGLTYISGDDPLFVHQYSHAWFDFRHRRDTFTNYFENSVTATRAHKRFCLDLGKPYSDRYWGITASDSATGYQAWGGPPRIGRIDGSVVPCAAAGSLPFLPADCLGVLKALKQDYGDTVYGRYGFRDAFHPAAAWYDPDVLGIDLGIGVLMAENLRSGFVWQTFAQNPEIPAAMRKAGLRRG